MPCRRPTLEGSSTEPRMCGARALTREADHTRQKRTCLKTSYPLATSAMDPGGGMMRGGHSRLKKTSTVRSHSHVESNIVELAERASRLVASRVGAGAQGEVG